MAGYRVPKAPPRERGFRTKLVRFLIVCEGAKTEPNYFKSLVSHISSDVIEIECHGEGRGTCALVNRAAQVKQEKERMRHLRYDRVWLVFDKDDFGDFDAAIELALSKGFACAWSNESFELWYCLHFGTVGSALSRKDYIRCIERAIRLRSQNRKYIYKKNATNMFTLLRRWGDPAFAKVCAQSLRGLYPEHTPYSLRKPCTTVDLLVSELESPESLLTPSRVL